MAKSVSTRSESQKSALSISLAIAASDEVPIATLIRNPELTCRAKGTNPRVVAEYAEALSFGATFPPVIAYRDAADGSLWLADGFHRVAASEAIGRTSVAVDIREGTYHDALVCAAGANASHGFRRSTADKRRAVAMLLAAFPEWSDRRLAEAAAVSDKTVSAVRGKSGAEIPHQSRTGKDGKAQRARKTARRGRRKAPWAVRALKPLGRILERVTERHPEHKNEASRVVEALEALLRKLHPREHTEDEETRSGDSGLNSRENGGVQ